MEDYRKIYSRSALNAEALIEDPIEMVAQWINEAEYSGEIDEVNAMTLSTISSDGYPKNRVVLLKEIQKTGFVFYTNYESEKGKSIQQNPNVSLSFFWPALERQIIIKGKAEKVSEQQSDAYFKARPKGSQLGAVVSNQSNSIPNRDYLENKLKALEEVHQHKPVMRPTYWGGYLVKPVMIEFWQGRPNRLHDRFRYSLNKKEKWTIERLAP